MIFMTIIFMIAISMMGACFSALSKDRNSFERRREIRANVGQFASR